MPSLGNAGLSYPTGPLAMAMSQPLLAPQITSRVPRSEAKAFGRNVSYPTREAKQKESRTCSGNSAELYDSPIHEWITKLVIVKCPLIAKQGAVVGLGLLHWYSEVRVALLPRRTRLSRLCIC